MKAPARALQPDPQLRDKLLSFYLETYSADELSDWLRDLGQNARGTIAERQQRIRAHSKYLAMPADEFPQQTEMYLKEYDSEYLAELCTALALSVKGSKDARYRRILREVRYREGWMSRYEAKGGTAPSLADVVPVLGWVPLLKGGAYEKGFYPIFGEELREVFGDDLIYEQLPVAHGSTLRIDFHVGHPMEEGVGIEVKMPTNNGEIQRTLGQLDQYKRRYKEDLILLILGGFLKPEQLKFLLTELESKQISVVVR